MSTCGCSSRNMDITLLLLRQTYLLKTNNKHATQFEVIMITCCWLSNLAGFSHIFAAIVVGSSNISSSYI
jgi:hypothetical protein